MADKTWRSVAVITFTVLTYLACTHNKDQQTRPSVTVEPVAAAKKVVVFIHGLWGSAQSTWRNEENGAYWPKLIREDPKFSGYEVKLVNYDTTCFERSSTIHETALGVRRKLEGEGLFEKYKEIYFVAHSMGGLLAKEMMVDIYAGQVESPRSVRAVLFFSTPSQGSKESDIAELFCKNPQLRDLNLADLNGYLQSLEDHWQDLLRDRQRANTLFPKSFCAYETKPTHGRVLVGRLNAATLCDLNPNPFNYDHRGIVKPSGIDSDIYLWARERILETSSLGSKRTAPQAREELRQRGFSGTIDEFVNIIQGDKPDRKEMIELFLDAGIDSNLSSTKLKVPFVQVAGNGDSSLLELFVAKGADVNVKERGGWTALFMASSYGDAEAVRFLVAKGADAHATDVTGATPLMRAAEGNIQNKQERIEIVKIFLDKNVDVNRSTFDGMTALMWASYWGRTEIIRMLLSHGADVNAKAKDGRTPLIRAAEGLCQTDAVKALLDAKADPDAKNKVGDSALSIAMRQRLCKPDVIDLLSQRR